MAPGRVKFVIGTGYTSASTIGRKPATLAQMRACIRTVKGLLAGQTVDFDGTPGRLGYASGRRHPGDHGRLGAEGDRAGRGDRRRCAASGRFQPRHHRARARPSRARCQARGPAARRPRDHLGGADRDQATTEAARRAARPTAVHWGVLRWGGYWLEPAGPELPKLEMPDAVTTGSIRISPTPKTGRLRSPRRPSSPMRLSPNSATPLASSERRPIAPPVSSRWRSSA